MPRTHLGSVRKFYAEAFTSIGHFAMAPIENTIPTRSMQRRYGSDTACLSSCCWACCCPIMLSCVIAGEVVTLTLALISVLALAAASPVVYATAASMDACGDNAGLIHFGGPIRAEQVNLAERGELPRMQEPLPVYRPDRIDDDELPLQAVRANRPILAAPLPADKIRRYYYENMIVQARLCIQKGWWTVQNIVDQDAEIMLTLPALVIIQALENSLNSEDFVLEDGSVLKIYTTPPQLGKLIEPMAEAKKSMKGLSDNQLELLRQKCFKTNSENEFEIIPELAQYETDEMKNLVSLINSTATKVTQALEFGHYMPAVFDKIKLDCVTAEVYVEGYESAGSGYSV